MRSGRNLENSVMFRDLLNLETRLSSIESRPRKVVVAVVILVVVVGLVAVIFVIIFGHRTLTLKFAQNWVNSK